MKTLLGAAAVTAYQQIMWYTLQNRGSKGVSVSGVNSFFVAPSSLFTFFDSELWSAAPSLLFIALVIWYVLYRFLPTYLPAYLPCVATKPSKLNETIKPHFRILPLVSVVTPSSLTIQTGLNMTTQNLTIPNIDYVDYAKYAEMQTVSTRESTGESTDTSPTTSLNVIYNSPSNRLARLVSSVASSGKIQNIAPPSGFQNASYSLNFYGPAYSCNPINSSLQDLVDENLSRFQANELSDDGELEIGYVSFVNTWKDGNDLAGSVNNAMYSNASVTYGNGVRNDSSTGSIYFSLQETTQGGGGGGGGGDADSSSSSQTWSTISCGLYNASYAVDFRFSSGEQDVTVTNKTLLDGIPCDPQNSTVEWNYQPFVMQGVMDALNTVLLGYVIYSPGGNSYSTLNVTNSTDAPNATNSYLITYSTSTNMSTQLGSTVLVETQEMQRLFALTGQELGSLTIHNATFAAALEEVVQNVTLSFFSDLYFLQNLSEATPLPVTVNITQNIYAYTTTGRHNLALAYGLGAGAGLVLVTIALVCISLTEGRTPTDVSFSSVLLVTRKLGNEVDKVVRTPPPARQKLRPWWRRCCGMGSGADNNNDNNLAKMRVSLSPKKEETEEYVGNRLETFSIVHEKEMGTSQDENRGSTWFGMRRRKGRPVGPVTVPLMDMSPDSSMMTKKKSVVEQGPGDSDQEH